MKRATTMKTLLAVLVLFATVACKQNRDAENLEGSDPGTAIEMDATMDNTTAADSVPAQPVDTVGIK